MPVRTLVAQVLWGVETVSETPHHAPRIVTLSLDGPRPPIPDSSESGMRMRNLPGCFTCMDALLPGREYGRAGDRVMGTWDHHTPAERRCIRFQPEENPNMGLTEGPWDR